MGNWNHKTITMFCRTLSLLLQAQTLCLFVLFGTAFATQPGSYEEALGQEKVEPSEFWSGILPLACQSSCERYFRSKDLPDQDCSAKGKGFCKDIVEVLVGNPAVERSLALADAKFGLNMMQWSMRDCVLAKHEKQPVPILPIIFMSRMEHYEDELKGRGEPENAKIGQQILDAQAKQAERERRHAEALAAEAAKQKEAEEEALDGAAFVDI